ncbi:lipase maturation factor 1-like [Acropora palmata]|uniref:lipase maturation factor 1-like n=1 Tax=Acropora palmata TaxID=6131 RepID=UPI003DA18120
MEFVEGLRKRSVGFNSVKEGNNDKLSAGEKTPLRGRSPTIDAGSYWLTRIVFLRSLGFIYFVAFAIASNQNKELLGKNGLLPSDLYLRRIDQHFADAGWRKGLHVPTLLLFTDRSKIDEHLDSLAYAGLALSGILIVFGSANMLIMALLWVLYHSIVNVGQRWYSFGWESQLLETGFLAIFLCPVVKMHQVPIHTPTPLVVIWGYRWLIFRIMIGAGMIKIRGDQCWRDLTCMNYHYETQPVPNPMSYFMHQSPEIFHKFETLTNHFIELIVPFFIILPRPFRITCGVLQILFQVILIISGNLSFLNWLTILPSIMCFDDKSLAFLFSPSSAKDDVIKIQELSKAGAGPRPTRGLCIRRVFEVMLGAMLAYLSIPVVQNLLSSQQAMNTSFDSFRIVNTYGAFGSVTKERTEVIFQGTRNATIVPDEAGGIWEEYQFHCKPGDPKRRPCVISPYHYRLDWLMWFAAFQNYQYNPWLIHLAAKLLANDEQATSLIAYNPFFNGTPPTFIRGEHFSYKFTKFGSKEAKAGYWWKRSKIGSYFPPINLQAVREYLKSHGWKLPIVKKKLKS